MEKQEFNIIKSIGKGSYGDVYLTNNNTVVKLINSYDKQIMDEQMSILSNLRHPNIITILNYGIVGGSYFIEMKYGGKSLRHYLREYGKLPRDLCIDVINQIIDGLEYLHDNNVIHGDLKPDNITYDENTKVAQIIDFDLIEKGDIFNEKARKYNFEYVSLWYRAPELLLGCDDILGKEVDIWALGCLIYELFNGSILFRGDGTKIGQVFSIFQILGTPIEGTITKCQYYNINFPKWKPNKISNNILYKSIFQYDPSKRASLRQIKELLISI